MSTQFQDLQFNSNLKSNLLCSEFIPSQTKSKSTNSWGFYLRWDISDHEPEPKNEDHCPNKGCWQ